MFKILAQAKDSGARRGVLETAHGVIETPAYVIVATHGQIKCLSSEQVVKSGTQAVIANTFHLWQNYRGEKKELDSLPDLHSLLPSSLPVFTDSGGFQIFSLGFAREQAVGKIQNIFPAETTSSAPSVPSKENLVRLTEEGAWFRHPLTAQEDFLGPELAIKIQEKLGADIILAFDECTSPLNDYLYTRQALERTHRWAKICLETKTDNGQKIYGIVQGGEFQDLREKSARFINSLPFDGLAIGGSLGKSKDDAWKVLKWTIPLLDKQKPRHFLGIGRVEDIFEGVEQGLDTFDCVIPTREARHGRIWTKRGHFDITKTKYASDYSPLEITCSCPVCQTSSKAEVHRQFKTKDSLAGQNATLHNVFFFNCLLREIREAIGEERLKDLKKEYQLKSTV